MAAGRVTVGLGLISAVLYYGSGRHRVLPNSGQGGAAGRAAGLLIRVAENRKMASLRPLGTA